MLKERGMTENQSQDIINRLTGIVAESSLGMLRAERPDVQRNAQASFEEIFEAGDFGELSQVEREASALRTAALHADAGLTVFYRARLKALGVDDALIAAAERKDEAADLPVRLVTILDHVELVTMAPRLSEREDLRKLEAAGLSHAAIVTLSQLVSFLAFQIRVVAGLKLLENKG
jgi:CMD domain protein